MVDSGGMDKNWIPPNADNEQLERLLKQERDDHRERERREERYRDGDYR